MHRLLERQIKKYLKDVDPEGEGYQAFIEAVEATYLEHDRSLHVVENTLEVVSAELSGANERVLQESKLEIERLNSHYQQTLERQNGMTFAVVKEGGSFRYTLARGKLIRNLGYKPEEIEGKLLKQCFHYHPAWQVKRLEYFQRAWAGEVCSCEITSEDNEQTYMEVYQPILEGDKTVEVICTCSNMTHHRKAKDQIIRAKEIAENASRAKSEFLANMSHEIRTPMNAIMGMTSLMFDTELDEEQKDYLNTIVSGNESLLHVINDILDFSKIEANQIDLEAIEFDLSDSIKETLDLFSAKASKKEIDLIFEIDPRVPLDMLGDPTRLRQVLVNLIGNAVKFTEVGEVVVRVRPTPHISCAAYLKNLPNIIGLEFSVSDTGIGIPEDRREELFKAFSQGDSSTTRRFGGTGLGLVISKKLVELLGGTIRFDSVESFGTNFVFNIQVSVAEQQRDRSVDTVVLENKRILLVESNDTYAQILENNLSYHAAKVIRVTNCHDALEVLDAVNSNVDLALIDSFAPDLDGLTLVHAIRRHHLPRIQRVPLIMLGPATNHAIRMRAMELGCLYYLAKPVSPTTLLSVTCDSVSPQSRKKKLIQAETFNNDKTSIAALSCVSDDDVVDRSKLRILVAEDNPVNSKLMKLLLTKLGFTNLHFVVDGLEALAFLHAIDIDVVLMDIHMPRLDGLGATRQLREELADDRQPYVIALTAAALKSDRESCAEVGMDEFLTKPLRPKEIEGHLLQRMGHRLEQLSAGESA